MNATSRLPQPSVTLSPDAIAAHEAHRDAAHAAEVVARNRRLDRDRVIASALDALLVAALRHTTTSKGYRGAYLVGYRGAYLVGYCGLQHAPAIIDGDGGKAQSDYVSELVAEIRATLAPSVQR